MEHMFVPGDQVPGDAPEVLAEILARLAVPGGLSPCELDALMVGLERVSRQVEAAGLAVVARAERTQHFASDGHRNVTSWQVALANCSRGTALSRTRAAHLVARAPVVGERLAAGWVGIEQVMALGRLAANPRCGNRLFDDDEAWIPQLLDLAASLPLTDFRLVVDRWEQLAEFATGHRQRSAAQRRADALVAVFHAAVGDGSPVEVTVNLVVDTDTLERMIEGRPLAPGPRARCETVDGTALPPSVLLSAALAGRVRSVVTDPHGVVTRLGRRRRLFAGAVREAARLQGVVCVWPGCGTSHTQIDHLDPWSRGGPTDPANAAPLCGWHNRWKHDHRYRIRRRGDGRYLVTRPDRTMMWVGTRPEEFRGHSRSPTR